MIFSSVLHNLMGVIVISSGHLTERFMTLGRNISPTTQIETSICYSKRIEGRGAGSQVIASVKQYVHNEVLSLPNYDQSYAKGLSYEPCEELLLCIAYLKTVS